MTPEAATAASAGARVGAAQGALRAALVAGCLAITAASSAWAGVSGQARCAIFEDGQVALEGVCALTVALDVDAEERIWIFPNGESVRAVETRDGVRVNGRRARIEPRGAFEECFLIWRGETSVHHCVAELSD